MLVGLVVSGLWEARVDRVGGISASPVAALAPDVEVINEYCKESSIVRNSAMCIENFSQCCSHRGFSRCLWAWSTWHTLETISVSYFPLLPNLPWLSLWIRNLEKEKSTPTSNYIREVPFKTTMKQLIYFYERFIWISKLCFPNTRAFSFHLTQLLFHMGLPWETPKRSFLFLCDEK